MTFSDAPADRFRHRVCQYAAQGSKIDTIASPRPKSEPCDPNSSPSDTRSTRSTGS